MKSQLEDKPEVLNLIGLFIVLFNLIDARLSIELELFIGNKNGRLSSLSTSHKLKLLKEERNLDLYKRVDELNEFRNQICHGIYSVNDSGGIQNTKRNKYGLVRKEINKKIMELYIIRERAILRHFHTRLLRKLKLSKKRFKKFKSLSLENL